MTQKHSKPTVNWPENLHFQGWFLRKMPSRQKLRGSEMLGSQARNKAPRSFELWMQVINVFAFVCYHNKPLISLMDSWMSETRE